MTPRTLSTSSIAGTNVKNHEGKDVGEIKELMINTNKGNVAYAVLSFGGFLGMGDKYFAIPWEAFSINEDDENFVLNIAKDKLENAPGFDKDNWPSTADNTYLTNVYNHYGYKPYWN